MTQRLCVTDRDKQTIEKFFYDKDVANMWALFLSQDKFLKIHDYLWCPYSITNLVEHWYIPRRCDFFNSLFSLPSI